MLNKVIEISNLKVHTNPAYSANLGRVGEIALCEHSRPDVKARLAGHQSSAKVYPDPVSGDRQHTWIRTLCKGYNFILCKQVMETTGIQSIDGFENL